MVAIITFINRSSRHKRPPMAPPPLSWLKEVITTLLHIKRTTWGQKHHNKVAKAFVGEEVDDQSHPNMDRIIDIDGQWCMKCLVTRHVGKAMTMEVHTTKTYYLCDWHGDDDHNTNALNDGDEVQGDIDHHEPNNHGFDKAISCQNITWHFSWTKIIYQFFIIFFWKWLFVFICVIHGFKFQASCPSMPIEEQKYGLKINHNFPQHMGVYFYQEVMIL